MPELPEVERAARQLRRAALGKTILAVKAIHPSLKKKLPAARSRRAKGKRIDSIERRGKHQLLQLDSGETLVVHFRMNGDWEIGTTSDPLDRFARAAIELTDGTRISLVDRRALSSITLDKRGESSLPRLGREASDRTLDADYFVEALRRKKIAIKPALLDQSVIAGLGNIYAAEALWEAMIDPRSPAAKVSRVKLEKLVDAIRLVLSPRKRRPGRYTATRGVSRFAVYDREGKECRRGDGVIERIVQAGRSTYFCPKCQRG
ncbi:MAG TPA: bifunctional DNA-formamidopyrimidine glycosylase/DNA-(apurinic or apyrimidinic site) lyase [Gemmatimonadaceae bacterium]|nr:bifunctional DNA-formamidopyrimidine glycosylase/DNA-(apurinic or apyrimidinic site) lyase [Gemmatimonadaceae bacterium]